MNGLKTFFKSVGFALRGIRASFQQQNTRIQWTIALLYTITGFILHFTYIEWLITLLCIGLVTSLELINSALEQWVDLVSPEYNPLAGKAKDLAAGSVLVAAVISGIIGFMILLNHLTSIFVL